MQQGPTHLFLDSNILLSRTLRDWFCLIDLESGAEGIRLRWSEDVLAEFLYHLRKRNPSASEVVTGGLRRRLENVCPEVIVEGYSIRTEVTKGTLDADEYQELLNACDSWTTSRSDWSPPRAEMGHHHRRRPRRPGRLSRSHLHCRPVSAGAGPGYPAGNHPNPYRQRRAMEDPR